MAEEFVVDRGSRAGAPVETPLSADPALERLGVSRRLIDLRLTRLHHLKAGDGPPLVCVPATISSIDSWVELVRFMAQRYTVYFFELPGHGGSTPFAEGYRAELVARTVGDLLDAEGHERASVMGFSFGGILALTTVGHLADRVDEAILLSPCATRRALRHSPAQVSLIRGLAGALRSEGARSALLSALHTRPVARGFAALAGLVGRVEKTGELVETLLRLPASTLDVLVGEISEIMTFEPQPGARFPQRLHFGMSVNDPMLDFDTTLATLEGMFAEVETVRWDFPYHQSPDPLTFEQLNRDYMGLLEATCGDRPRRGP